jgi:hypothetical protein
MSSTNDAEPGSWAAVDHDSQRFRALLTQYDGDYQLATDAYLRGDEPEAAPGGSENPM